MFLMNAPPVVALQSAWEAFGRPGSCRFPARFSEPEGVGRAAVSARVQMIISTLQGDRAARGRSQERALHRGQRGREAQPAASPASAACGLAADFDPGREADAADLGRPVLDSDSDDSVDRDIEEAIQEYLKAKSGAAQPAAAAGDSPRQPEPPQSSAPPSLCPSRLAPGSGGAPGGRVGASEAPGSASPLSVSSEDSFEQSIRAEIEQFLNEKRQCETPRRDAPADGLPRPALRACKEPGLRAQRQELAGACKEFVFRKPPRLAKAAAQPRSLRSKATPEPESLGGPKPAAPRPPATPRPPAAGRPAEAQSKVGARRNPAPGRRGQGAKSAALVREASDSSSDDGIEEAIQLYQLEKRKAGGDPLGEEPPEAPARGTSHITKSALPETHRRTLGKKKPVTCKAVDLGPGGPDADHPSKPPKDTKAPAAAAPGNAAAKSELAEASSCRADASAELMCAEAILDISKAILPAPGEGRDGPLCASPPPGAPSVPSRSDGDSSSVDSDDSIEREIRTFLALKAQSGTPLARANPCPQTAQSPLPPPGPHGQASGPKAPASRTRDLPLSRGRRRSATSRSSAPRKASEVAKEGTPDSDPGQGAAGEAPGREGEARGQPPPCRTVGLGDELAAPDVRGGVSPSLGKAVESRSVDERGSSEDKSSSLDSDEDLDTAIKDLLRSKRRLRKRCREPRAACRKKVRFSATEARPPGRQGSLQRGWTDRSPHLLKSCLSKSKRDGREDPLRRPSSVFCSEAERAKPGGTGPTDTLPALPPGQRAGRGHGCSGEAEAGRLHGAAAGPSSRSEDSSSVDSDDSIELEIRKFLAEKAKESGSGLEVQEGGPTTLGPGSVPRPEPPGRKAAAPALQPGVCTRSQRGRGTPQPSVGPRGSPHAEQACLPAALSRGQRAPPRGTSEPVSARGPPAGRRNLHPPRDQSSRGAGPATGDSAFGPPSGCAEAGAGAGRLGGTLPVSSRGRGTLTRGPGADREGGPQASLALPWGDFAHQSRLQSTWALSSEGRDAAWKGGLGSEREVAAVEGQARGAPSLATDPKKGLPFPGFSPLCSSQLFHFGSSVAWAAKPAGLFSPGLGLPPQGPSFSAFREAPGGPGPVFGSSHLLGKKEGGHWPRRKAPATLSFHSSRNSGSDEDVLDLRYRRRVDRDLAKDQETWGSDASELSDTSVEDGGSVAPGKALKL